MVKASPFENNFANALVLSFNNCQMHACQHTRIDHPFSWEVFQDLFKKLEANINQKEMLNEINYKDRILDKNTILSI